ncbi:MAG: hypothetical protein ABI591_28095 [Kofleriaceae bacterium]
MRNLTIAIFAVAALSTAADAKPRRVVVVDFDGLPRNLADTGRSNVMSLLGNEYDLVPTKKWESARANAPGRGPQQWQQASKSSGVDAVIEGWVNSEGRHHTLTVQVRDALTGNEIDSVSVTIGDKGLTSETQKSLTTQLDDILTWIDADATSDDVTANLPPPKAIIDAHKPKRHVDDDDGDDDDRDVDVVRHGGRHHHKSLRHIPADDDSDDRSDDRRDRRDDDRRDNNRRDDDRRDDHRSSRDFDDSRDRDDLKRSDKDRANAPSLKAIATADPIDANNTNDLQTYLPADSEEAKVIAQSKAPRIMTPTPKYFLEGGAFISSRGMNFTHNPPDSVQEAPDYPAQGLAGISIQASIYPYPVNKLDYDPSGIGFSFGIQKSVGSLLTTYDADLNSYGDYVIDNTAYNGAIHYRMPFDILIADGDLSYGKFGYAIEGLGTNIPDVDYTYLGIGGTVDLKVTDRTRAGFGAHYMYLLDAGDVSDEKWYGSGSASGLDLEAHFQIPISDMLFVRGQLDYRRVSMDFEQSGDVSNALEIGSITDSTIGGSALLGVQF